LAARYAPSTKSVGVSRCKLSSDTAISEDARIARRCLDERASSQPFANRRHSALLLAASE
jgi:hypothetical protein